jgi:hypothetical protein
MGEDANLVLSQWDKLIKIMKPEMNKTGCAIRLALLLYSSSWNPFG